MINNQLNFDNFKEKEINDIKIYSVSNVAYNIYRENAKRDSNISKEILEIKLTAMILSTNVVSNLNGKKVYRFGGFCMVVNPNTYKIETVSWFKDNHYNHGNMKSLGNKLKENYTLLGLNEEGNDYLKELIEI